MPSLTEQHSQRSRYQQQVFSFPESHGQLFATYVANQQVVHAIGDAIAGNWHGCIYLWGESGTGKTHLLRASCLLAEQDGIKCSYSQHGDIAEDNVGHDIVCIDDLQDLPESQELQLLSCYEQLQQRQGLLLVAANVPPAQLRLGLADVKSRLSAGLVFRLSGLDDAEKMQAIKLRLQAKSMDIAEEVLQVLLQRLPRDMHSLLAMLDDIIEAARVQQLRLSANFIHRYLSLLDS